MMPMINVTAVIWYSYLQTTHQKDIKKNPEQHHALKAPGDFLTTANKIEPHI